MHANFLLTVIVALASHGLADTLSGRGLPDGPPDKIQDCAAGGDYKGAWTDNSGTYINSDSVRHPIGKKCWNDYFVVDSEDYNSPWYTISQLNCSTTNTCTSGITKSQSECFTHTEQISVDFGIQAIGKLFGASLSTSIMSSWSDQNCHTDQRDNECTWNDQACHTMSGQDVMIRQRGYKRERCNTGGGSDKDFTNCMSDWETTFPKGVVNYGCGGQCSSEAVGKRSVSMAWSG